MSYALRENNSAMREKLKMQLPKGIKRKIKIAPHNNIKSINRFQKFGNPNCRSEDGNQVSSLQ